MRFANPFAIGGALRLSGNISEWPMAVRFALLVIPTGLCMALASTWLGYRAASPVLHESLEAVPLLEAKAQAARMGDILSHMRNCLSRIAQTPDINAQNLQTSLHLFFQDNTDLVQEFSYKHIDGRAFMLLRDKNAFTRHSEAEASAGPYSPFQQVSSSPLYPGKALLFPPVYFDAAGGVGPGNEARVPVMRLAMALPESAGILVLGIDMRGLRNRLAAPMQSDSPLHVPSQEGALQLAFFFDTRGWILFEMDNSGSTSYLPDIAREGYTGDLGRAGFDAAFRPWTTHENFWGMVTETSAGRSGSIVAPGDKYGSSNVGASGMLCYSPVFFSPYEGAAPSPVGGIAFFETSTLPLAAFLRLANNFLGVLVVSLLVFGLLSFWVGRRIAKPLGRMADELSHMASTGSLDFVDTEPACEEQQSFQSAVNNIIAGAMSTRNELDHLSREVQQARSRQPVDLSQTQTSSNTQPEFGLIGASSLIREVREHVRKAARAGTDVLVWGETGTGKELVAAAIHKASARHAGPYISINCGALDENLLLDALFGHVKGAFTEAKSDRRGAFLSAEGGTLHLDEIANASLKVQQALLRALSVRRIRPLGTDEEVSFNTRVVAATNVDLRECVRAGTFREDLYYRLAIISIETPPLRHRKEDIPELAAFCIHDAAIALGRPEARLSRGALDLMAAHDWPGNVREFKNCLTRAMAFVEGDLILRQHITLEQDAFRTYAKPIAPQVLAEKIHPADLPPPRREKSLPDKASASANSEPSRQAHHSDSPGRDMAYAAEQLWPPPPRKTFTPARSDALPAPPQGNGGGNGGNNGRYSVPVQENGTPPPAFDDPRLQPVSPAPAKAGGARGAAPAPSGTAASILQGLNERQMKALDYVRAHGEMSRAEYEAAAGQELSSRTAQNDLRELVERGILHRVGAGPGTRYTLVASA